MSTERDGEGAPRRGLGFIERIIDFSGRNRLIVFILAGALAGAGAFLARRTPLDALPDLSDTQVIVATEWMGRNPTLIENQITYPIVTTFLGVIFPRFRGHPNWRDNAPGVNHGQTKEAT